MSHLLVEDIGLQIIEAHAFSTVDGYALYFFIVNGWQVTFFLLQCDFVEFHNDEVKLIYTIDEGNFYYLIISF